MNSDARQGVYQQESTVDEVLEDQRDTSMSEYRPDTEWYSVDTEHSSSLPSRLPTRILKRLRVQRIAEELLRHGSSDEDTKKGLGWRRIGSGLVWEKNAVGLECKVEHDEEVSHEENARDGGRQASAGRRD